MTCTHKGQAIHAPAAIIINPILTINADHLYSAKAGAYIQSQILAFTNSLDDALRSKVIAEFKQHSPSRLY